MSDIDIAAEYIELLERKIRTFHGSTLYDIQPTNREMASAKARWLAIKSISNLVDPRKITIGSE